MRIEDNNRRTILTPEESRCLTVLKGLAILLVIFIHVDLRPQINMPDNQAIDLYFQALSRILPINAVPMFFFISGFLFFLKSESILTKWKKRYRTLVIPYFCWCLIGFLIPFVFQIIFGLDSLYSGTKLKLIKDFNIIDYIRMFWDIRDGAPILLTMWFLRNLIVMVLLTPIIWWLIGKFKYIFPIILTIIYFFVNTHLQWLSSTSIFYFSFGCFFASDYSNGLKCINRLNVYLIASLWILFFIGSLYTYSISSEFYDYILKLFIIVNSILLYKFILFLTTKRELNFLMFLSGISFFLYAFHEPWLGYTISITFKYLHPNGFVLYLLPFLFVIYALAISYLAYIVLNKTTPSLLNILTGSRKQNKNSISPK